jgi:phosphoribosyl-ATP pyrophosphohydrolase/phosphoribosyl-AMP cyclohydrolase
MPEEPPATARAGQPPAPEASALLAAVTFDGDGLVPVVAQEARTGMVRMVAWANRDALAKTVETGAAHFWSRSRKALWKKGESSGHTLGVREVRLDCDGDVVLYLVAPEGPSCHTGATSCFFRKLGPDGALVEDDRPPDPPAVIVARVADVIAKRRRERPEKSYVVSLLDAGFPKIGGKITEEAGELVEALPEGDAPHTAHEAADLLFHILVGLEAAGVPADAVFTELGRRFGVSGIDEKASRKK